MSQRARTNTYKDGGDGLSSQASHRVDGGLAHNKALHFVSTQLHRPTLEYIHRMIEFRQKCVGGVEWRSTCTLKTNVGTHRAQRQVS